MPAPTNDAFSPESVSGGSAPARAAAPAPPSADFIGPMRPASVTQMMIHHVTCTLFTHWLAPSAFSTFSYTTFGSAEMNDENSVRNAAQYTALVVTPATAVAVPSSWNCTISAPAISRKTAPT